MMDNFLEEVAVRRKPGLYNVLYMLCWLVMILTGILALIGLENILMVVMSGGFDASMIVSLILTLLFGAAAFLCWRNKDSLKMEYEYTFTNGDLDVSRVLNNQKRKYLTCLNMKNVDAAGPVNSPSFQRFVTMNGVKKHNWFLNRDAKLYYFFFTKNQIKHLIIVELSDEMISLVQKPGYLNFGVWQK